MAEKTKSKEGSGEAYLHGRRNELNRRFRNWGITFLAGTGAVLASPFLGAAGVVTLIGGTVAEFVGVVGMTANLIKRPFVRK